MSYIANPSVKIAPESHIQYILINAKKYCVLKTRQEQQFKKYRESFDNKLKDSLQELCEDGLSKRKINACRVMFEKSKEAVDVINPNSRSLTPKEKAERIFYFINEDFGEGNASTHFKFKYHKSEKKILDFYTLYYETQEHLEEVKNKMRMKLNCLKHELVDNGVPPILLQYVYKRLKTDLEGLNKTIKEEVDLFDNIYTQIREEMIREVSHV